ncbi:ABC transporter ATP-binding protein [Mesorhizobium sp. 1B3]|uniref:ABC transporter ATP-binding protein n=1 Tax=Mesorhizobium sp. 1B3 TaxID=3243599 RepID=UPI003D993870
MTAAPLLSVENLTLSFPGPQGRSRVIEDVSFKLDGGEILGLVGESGCGKSVTALSIAGLVPTPPGRFENGRILFRGRNLLTMNESERRSIKGREIAMIFQEPMTSLNPVFTVGDQIAEVFRTHLKLDRRESWKRAVEALDMVRIPAAARRAGDYPHQLSGGMRQRVMIAIALACKPALLIADEPTTALDVTVQAQILELVQELTKELGTAVLLISHDLALVAEVADRMAVAYAGQIIEEGAAAEIYAAQHHPYTRGLFHSMPQLGTRSGDTREMLTEIAGSVPSRPDRITGCRFRERCALRQAECAEDLALFRGTLAARSRCILDRPQEVTT